MQYQVKYSRLLFQFYPTVSSHSFLPSIPVTHSVSLCRTVYCTCIFSLALSESGSGPWLWRTSRSRLWWTHALPRRAALARRRSIWRGGSAGLLPEGCRWQLELNAWEHSRNSHGPLLLHSCNKNRGVPSQANIANILVYPLFSISSHQEKYLDEVCLVLEDRLLMRWCS